MTNKCKKCAQDITKTCELAAVSSDGSFETYNYYWQCPCGFSNESECGV